MDSTSQHYVSVATTFSPVGNSATACQTYGSAASCLIPTQLARVLALGSSSGTIDELADRGEILMKGQALTRASIHDGLQQLIRLGLLVPIGEVVCSSNNAPVAKSKSIKIAIPTSGRPANVERCILAILNVCEKHSRLAEISIVDDATNPTRPDALVSMLQSRISPGVRALRYSDRSMRNAFADQLVKAGLEPSIINFALLGSNTFDLITTGSARNTILLDYIGEEILSVDDDIIFSAVNNQVSPKEVVFSGHSFPWDLEFYASKDELSAMNTWDGELDPAACHEAVLGQRHLDLSTDFTVRRGEARFESICPHVLSQLLKRHGSRVLVTTPGLIGDAGTTNGVQWLLIKGQWSESLAENEDLLATALSSRLIKRAVRNVTVNHSPAFQAYCVGLSNDNLLPPFMPFGRNEDGLFGYMMQTIAPGSIAHLPFAMLHDPQGPRRYAQVPPFRLTELMLALVIRFSLNCDFVQNVSVSDIGRHLKSVGTMDNTSFLELLIAIRNQRIQQELAAIESSIKEHPSSCILWTTTLRKMRAKLIGQFESNNSFLPEEARQLPSLQDGLEWCKSLILATGRLFVAWPDMREVAKGLKARDVRLSALMYGNDS